MSRKDERSGDATEMRKKAEALVIEKANLSPEVVEAMSPDEIQLMLHELRVHQIELEMQNEELRRVQENLENSRTQYFDLYELAPVGYLTISEKGMILEANLTFTALLGVARGKLIMQPFSRFIVREDQDIYYRHRKTLFDTSDIRVCELRLHGKDGTPFWARLEEVLVLDANGAPVYRTVVSNITVRKLAELKILDLSKISSENPNPILRVDDGGVLQYANDACFSVLKDWALKIGKPAPPLLRERISEALAKGSENSFEIKHGELVISFAVVRVVKEGYVNLYGSTERKLAMETPLK
jgi:PAS domain S-box-containing protein